MLYCIGIIGLSIGIFYLFQYLLAYFNITPAVVGGFVPAAYAVYVIIFITSFLCNASIMIPAVYVHVSLMIATSSYLNPIIVALVASVAATLGEISGYYAGYWGKKIVITENIPWYNKFTGWVHRHGILAIFLISLQPVLPVDIAGLTAGASKLPLWKFLLPCWLGRFPKYILFCYFGYGLLNLLPFIHPPG